MSKAALPYENATSGNNALNDIQKILRGFGCTKFGFAEDTEAREVIVQFEHRGRPVIVRASAGGYAAAWLRAHPFKPSHHRITRAQYEARALEKGGIAVYSILRDWIKGQVTAVEIGMFSAEAAFLSHMLLPSGQTVIEHVQAQKLLPPPTEGVA